MRGLLSRDRPLIEEGPSKGSWVTERPLTEQGLAKRQLGNGPANENTEEEAEAAERKNLHKERKPMITPGWYEVVHSHVVARAAADVTSSARAVLKRGTKVFGTLDEVSGSPWLLLSREFCISELQLPQALAEVWVLTHGFRIGLGALLKPIEHMKPDSKEAFEEKAAKLAVEKAAVAKDPAEEEVTSAVKIAKTSASPKAQSKREFQQKAAAQRAAAEEREKEAANEEAFTEIDVKGHMAKEKAAKFAAKKAAAEKELAEEQAARLPAEKVAVAKEPAKHKQAFSEKVSEMSASPKAQRSKHELQLKPTPKSASERAAAEERANEVANKTAFTEIDVEGHYRVIHDKVALRESPSTNAKLCGLGKRSMEFIGTPCQVGETTWLRLNREKSTALGAFLIYGHTQAWVLIDGTISGCSLLLQRIKEAEQVTRAPIDKQMAECKGSSNAAALMQSFAKRRAMENAKFMSAGRALEQQTADFPQNAENKQKERKERKIFSKLIDAGHVFEQQNGELSEEKMNSVRAGKGVATDCEKERQQQEMPERPDELNIDMLLTAAPATKTPTPKPAAVKENTQEEAKAAELKILQKERKQQNARSDELHFAGLGDLLKPVEQIEPDANSATKVAQATKTSTPKAVAVNENTEEESQAAEVKKAGEVKKYANSWWQASMEVKELQNKRKQQRVRSDDNYLAGPGELHKLVEQIEPDAKTATKAAQAMKTLTPKAAAVNENAEEEARAAKVNKAAEERKQQHAPNDDLDIADLGELLKLDAKKAAKAEQAIKTPTPKAAAVNENTEEETRTAGVKKAAEEETNEVAQAAVVEVKWKQNDSEEEKLAAKVRGKPSDSSETEDSSLPHDVAGKLGPGSRAQLEHFFIGDERDLPVCCESNQAEHFFIGDERDLDDVLSVCSFEDVADATQSSAAAHSNDVEVKSLQNDLKPVEQTEPCAVFLIGERIELTGFQAHPTFNGLKGTLKQKVGQLWTVDVDESGIKFVQAKNLRKEQKEQQEQQEQQEQKQQKEQKVSSMLIDTGRALEHQNRECSEETLKRVQTGKGVATAREKERRQQEMLERQSEMDIDVLSTAAQATKTPTPKPAAVNENTDKEARAADVKKAAEEQKCDIVQAAVVEVTCKHDDSEEDMPTVEARDKLIGSGEARKDAKEEVASAWTFTLMPTGALESRRRALTMKRKEIAEVERKYSNSWCEAKVADGNVKVKCKFDGSKDEKATETFSHRRALSIGQLVDASWLEAVR